MRHYIIFLGALAIMILSGCSQPTEMVVPTIKPTGKLTPYRTITPTKVEPTSTLKVTIPVTPTASATPFLHTITNDDTLLGLAFQYGVTLDEILAANPGIDPHFLSVGKQLIIPINGEIEKAMPIITPEALLWEQPTCYPTGEGGRLCIMSVKNSLEYSVENISAWIGLLTPQGTIIKSQTVYTPLNLLKPGETTPVMAYFKPPISTDVMVRGELVTAIRVAEDDQRYIDASLEIESETISTDGKQATVIGKVVLPDGTESPSQVWVLAVAYAEDGRILGARRWESNGETEFTLSVFAVEGMIDHIDVICEARR